jgi:hypothetical protein
MSEDSRKPNVGLSVFWVGKASSMLLKPFATKNRLHNVFGGIYGFSKVRTGYTEGRKQ